MRRSPIHRLASHRLARAVAAALVLAGPALLCGCRNIGVLDPKGPIGAAERLILINATGIMLVVVAPVIVLTLAAAWWYRASNRRARYRPDWSYSGQIELVVWAIPAMVVILLAAVGWIGAHDLDPRARLTGSSPPLRVEVVSLDWKWLFIYPDERLATVNEIVVPVGTPLALDLTSATVMNAFFVPQLGTQIYTMPGMVTHLNLRADQAGNFPGLSSHFSGNGFSDMRFTVHAVPSGEYTRWVAETRAKGARLDANAFATLAAAATPGTAAAYGAVESGFFERLVHRSARMRAD